MLQVGTGPFLDGLRLTSGWAVAAALAITAATTACCAWRWRLVAAGLGVDLPMSRAVGAYYRSQFLNLTLPGGVLGDVHRGVRHGRAVEHLSRGLRSVAWERTAGQTVQLVVTAGVLLALAAPVGPVPVFTVILALVGVAGLWLLVRRSPADPAPQSPTAAGQSRRTRLARVVTGDLRDAVLTRAAGPGIVIASVVALAGYVAVYAIAVHSTGAELPPGRLIPVALVVLTVAALPMNVAGWGPREGASAGAFAVAGVGAASGVTVAVVFGVLTLLATLPGAVLLLLDWRAGRRPGQPDPTRPGAPVHSGDVPAQVEPAWDGPLPARRAEGELHA